MSNNHPSHGGRKPGLYFGHSFLSIFALFCLLQAPVYGAGGAANSPESRKVAPQSQASLQQSIQQQGRARVLVTLADDSTAARHEPQTLAERRLRASRLQQKLLPRLSAKHAKVVRRHQFLPSMAMTVDEQGMAELLAQDLVVAVEPDRLLAPTLAGSTPMIGAAALHDAGVTGAGQAVAILDSGVLASHSFFGGRVVEEACYSTTDASVSATSECPGGVQSLTGPGAAAPCSGSGCGHGTHVAGIAAGFQSTTGSTLSGVANQAEIIAIQVFSKINDPLICGGGTPCFLAFTSDIIAGLERVYALRNSYDIAAANMSLGGSLYSRAIDCDQDNPVTKSVIDLLRGVGIATVISAGNSGRNDAMGAPACISSAVSVASSTDQDALSGFSNAASWTSLVAPGSGIFSSLPGGFGSLSGTSMAAPQVAGAFALLREHAPSASVSALLSAMQQRGVPLVLPGSGFIKPRIQLDEAAELLVDGIADPVDVIVDNDYGGAALSGTFAVINDDSAFRGRYQLSIGSDNVYNFVPTLPETGHYRVSAWWHQGAGSSAAAYDVNHSGGLTTVTVDQTTGGGNWHELGIYSFAAGNSGSVQLSDRLGGAVSADAVRFRFVVPLPLTVESTSLVDAKLGFDYDKSLTASGGLPPYQWQVNGTLPPGLSLSADGQFSGVPTALGSWVFEVQVTDSEQTTVAQSLTLAVVVPPPAPAEIIIDNLDGNVALTGTWAFSSGANPWAGTSIYSNDGGTFRWLPTLYNSQTYEVFAWWTDHANRITNVPYKIGHAGGETTVIVNQQQNNLAGQWNSLGTFHFNPGTGSYVEVSGENGQANADAVRFVAVGAAPLAIETASLTDGTVGDNYSESLSGSGGTPPYAWGVVGQLPPGLQLDADDGEISGVPTLAGLYNFTLTLVDQAAGSTEKALSILVADSSLDEQIIDNLDANTSQTGTWLVSSGAAPWDGQSIYSNSDASFSWLPNIAAETTYQVFAWWTYHANRSEAVPYTIEFGGQQQTVLVNQRDPALAGSWQLLGSFTFDPAFNSEIRIDSSGGQANADAVRLVPVGVAALTIQTSSLPQGIMHQAYGAQVTASGGEGPYQWQLTGVLPTGISFDEASGQFSGTPTESGSWPLQLAVSDQQGDTDSAELILVVGALEIIVDNLDANTSQSGTWQTSSGPSPWAGNSRYNNGGNSFRWSPAIPVAGSYQVYAWWTYHANRSDNVPYRISHDGGLAEVIVNQADAALGGQWRLLGTFDLSPGDYVEVSSDNGQACADAIRLVGQ